MLEQKTKSHMALSFLNLHYGVFQIKVVSIKGMTIAIKITSPFPIKPTLLNKSFSANNAKAKPTKADPIERARKAFSSIKKMNQT
ncbi:hypothetical protein [Lysinibacillus sp. 54212]|uniref:hypothetical protein n=1 Tax=Lysinibacillus sp. 54212 TaxID=3119829 RepID=UPI002FC652FC